MSSDDSVSVGSGTTSPLPDGVGVERLRTEAFLSSPDLVLVVDHERRVRAINPAGLAMIGTHEPEVIGQPLRTLLVEDAADAAITRIDQALDADRDLEVDFRSGGGSGGLAGSRSGGIVLGLRVAPLVIDGARCGLGCFNVVD